MRDQAVARGGVGEGFTPLPCCKRIRRDQRIQGTKDRTTTLNAYDPKGRRISLEASWSRLGALQIASKWPDRDRPEVKGRWVEHLWPAMVPGERHLSKNID